MNSIINFLITYWAEIIWLIAVVVITLVAIKELIPLSKEEKYEQIKTWLLGAVTLAEKEYGSGTGKLKLSVVYDKFVERFPWVAKILPFSVFSEYVDSALVEMRNLLSTNDAIASIVSEDDKNTKEE